MITKKCRFCQRNFSVFPYRKTSALYCSRSCQAKYRHSHGFSRKGSRQTLESRLKMSKAKKGLMLGNTNGFKKGHTPWNKGLNWEGISGENHWNWKGGVPQRYEGKSTKVREWAKSIYKRDFFTCQFCGKHCATDIQAHHIDAWAENKGKRFDVNNGLTLCFKCHLKTRGKEKFYAPLCFNLLKLKDNPMYIRNIRNLRFGLP